MALWFLAFAIALALRPAAEAREIFDCGGQPLTGETGTLTADLDRTGRLHGLFLFGGSTLRLNGHSIAGASTCVLVDGPDAVIEGPGEIVGCDIGVGVTTNPYRRRVTIRNGVVLRGHRILAIALGQQKPARLFLDGVTIRDNMGAIGDWVGLRLDAREVLVTGNGSGLAGKAIRVRNSTITGTAGAGIWGGGTARVWVYDSTVTGNGIGPEGYGYDIVTSRRPRLYRSTCGRSTRVAWWAPVEPNLPPWRGLCLNDRS